MKQAVHHTYHAERRQAQRNLSAQDVEFVLEYGRRLHRAGALHIFLGKNDIPDEKEIQRRFGRLEGTTLIMDDSHAVPVLITAYRNRHGFKQVRTKTKYHRKSRQSLFAEH